jgi:hypothetical protein
LPCCAAEDARATLLAFAAADADAREIELLTSS